MYLKRLEMVGFKSFADRTRLEFEPGITAIVGPNGCGKSNVVDALRWCLGEMSAKSLRSKLLIDVIFNGSANRPPSNLSEVSLTFDNAQKVLPIDYAEITVTRRLFRSGESEYYMNKTQCRLKDIRELFLDTGVGEEGYSIMEQGRVEYILNARPEERRELFEEAAGVSKYKARREEALRKLERTQLDLDRLADVIALTKEQMDKIEAAVRKARQYQKLQDDFKALEVAHWIWESAQLDEQMSSMRQALQVIESDLQQKTADIHQGDARLTELRWQETQLGERLVELNRALSELDGATAVAEQRQATAREREEEIRHRDLILDAELSQGRSRQAELARLAEEVGQALEAERRAADESAETLRKAEEFHGEKAELLKEVERRSQSLQESLWKVNQERAHMHGEISSQKSLEARLEMRRASQEKDRAKAEEQIQALAASLAEGENESRRLTDESRELDERTARVREALQAADAALAALDKAREAAQSAYHRAKAQLDAQDELESSDPYARGVQAALSAGLPGLQGPLGKLISVSPADETAVRRALGAHVNDLVADTWDQARAGVSFLAEQGRGRARFLVLDRLPAPRPSTGTPSGARAVLDMVRIDDKLRPALSFLLEGWGTDGGALYGEGFMEGGAEEAAAPAAFDSLRRENLKREMDRCAADLEKLAAEKETEDGRRKSLAVEWETLRQTAESARARNDFFLQDLDRRRTQLAQRREELVLLGSDVESLRQEEQKAQDTARALQDRVEAATAQETALRAEWTGLQEALQIRQSDALVASSQLAVAKERASGHQERLRWKEKQKSDIETERAALATGLESKSHERAGSGERLEEQRRVQEESRMAVEDLLRRRHQVSTDLEALHAERQALHGLLTEAQNSLADLRERADQMQGQFQDKKMQLSHSEFRREAIETQIKDKYALTVAEARERHGLPSQPPASSELERLRRRVEGMGPVNLAAPEEHAQLEERYNFLLSQQQDLVKAKEDLLATIQKVNASTRQNFRDTFVKVRENFQTLYGRLFPGGEADVRLTDEADVLNTGVEIFAQPPGKKLQNITLLSGGEKALTAVALLFAFFMVRPAPFCVLDEVDAPLDEANVTRFIALLKTFTAQSQFVMITHNKRSMETADTLYGVTMETLGVSRTLSARLRREGEVRETVSPESVIAGGAKN